MNRRRTFDSNASADEGAEQLERNGERIRADMDEVLEALEQKFSPGQVVDRSVEFLREHGSDISREVADAVRRNPVPLLLSAVGLAWFTISMTRSGSEGRDRQTRQMRGQGASREDRYETSHRYETSRQGSRGRAENLRGEARAKVQKAADVVRDRSSRLGSQMQSVVSEQPLALGALALAAGAILGVALPLSEYERRTMQPLRERALAKAEQLGERSYDRVREALRPEEGRGERPEQQLHS
jgi:ElaB/YqjD/DUF883 family membrane-anchored ribosome-binding protein